MNRRQFIKLAAAALSATPLLATQNAQRVITLDSRHPAHCVALSGDTTIKFTNLKWHSTCVAFRGAGSIKFEDDITWLGSLPPGPIEEDRFKLVSVTPMGCWIAGTISEIE